MLRQMFEWKKNNTACGYRTIITCSPLGCHTHIKNFMRPFCPPELIAVMTDMPINVKWCSLCKKFSSKKVFIFITFTWHLHIQFFLENQCLLFVVSLDFEVYDLSCLHNIIFWVFVLGTPCWKTAISSVFPMHSISSSENHGIPVDLCFNMFPISSKWLTQRQTDLTPLVL